MVSQSYNLLLKVMSVIFVEMSSNICIVISMGGIFFWGMAIENDCGKGVGGGGGGGGAEDAVACLISSDIFTDFESIFFFFFLLRNLLTRMAI